MKKLLMVICLLTGMVSLGKAQRQQRSPADQAKQMQTQLTLTDDQTAKITAILTTQAAKQDSIRTASNGDRQAMMTAMAPMRKMYTDKIKAVLTPDQVTAYDKMQADMMQRRGGGGGGGGMGGGGGTPPPPTK